MTSTYGRDTSHRISGSVLAVFSAVTLTASLFSPVTPLALADVNDTIGISPRDGVEQQVPENIPALAWGIRGSFYDYVSGATHVLDGAKQGSGDYFLWPYKSITTTSTTTTIQYGGTVNFMKYCSEEPPQRGKCSLDFTFADPKIEFDTKTGTGYLYATVHTKNYQGGTWSGPTEVQVGTIDTNTGRYNIADGLTTWTGVTSKLTKDGNSAFSNFYEVGGYLDELNFSYPSTADINETQTGYNLRNRISTNVEFDGANHLFPRPDGTVLHTSGSGKAQIFDKELSSVQGPFDLTINRNGAAAYDENTDKLYTVKDNKVYAANVTATSVEPAQEIATLSDNADTKVLGFAYSKATNELGIVHQVDYNTQFFTTIQLNDGSASKVETVTLPTPQELYPDLGNDYFNELYGSSFGAYNQGLRALPDGTFISVFDHTIPRIDNEDGTGSTPIHITPHADVKASLIDAAKDMFKEKNSYRGVVVDDSGNIAIYNNNTAIRGEVLSRIGFLKYENGTFRTVGNVLALEDAADIAGVTFDKDGNVAITSDSRSQVIFVDPATGTIQDKANLSENMKDTKQLYDLGTVFASDGTLYVIDRPVKDYLEYVGVQRLTLPSADGRVDTTLKPFKMSDQTQPVDPGKNDQTKPNIPTPTESTTPSASSTTEKPTSSIKPSATSSAEPTAKPTESSKPAEPESSSAVPTPTTSVPPKNNGSSGSSTVIDGSWARNLQKILTNAGLPNPFAKLLSAFGWLAQIVASPILLLLKAGQGSA